MHQRVALALGDDLATLVDGAVKEQHDALRRPRFALAHLQYFARHMQRIAVKDRFGKDDIRHAEIGDGRAKRRLVHGDADHQAEREQRVDDALAELGGLAVFLVEMKLRRVVGHGGEEDVVRLRHGAPDRMLELLSDGKFFEI